MGKLYTDKVDVNTQISLYEYGIIRNPKNGRTIFVVNTNELNQTFPEDGPFKPRFVVTYISLEDVVEALTEIENGFFDFIGADNRHEYIMGLDKDNLAHEIQSLLSYGLNSISDHVYCDFVY